MLLRLFMYRNIDFISSLLFQNVQSCKIAVSHLSIFNFFLRTHQDERLAKTNINILKHAISHPLCKCHSNIFCSLYVFLFHILRPRGVQFIREVSFI